MKTLIRAALIVGLIIVLTPCACNEIARMTGSPCPASARDCCGGSGLDLHPFMDQQAAISPAVHIPPLVLGVRADLMTPFTALFGVVRIGTVSTHGHSPPSFRTPLLI